MRGEILMLKSPTTWPAWKHYLIMLLIFAMGIIVGRLVLENWLLLLISGVIMIGLLLLLYTERKSVKRTMPVMKQARKGK
jgi:lipoprotein signal peptidase